MMTRNLSIELAPLGITINKCRAGSIETRSTRNLLTTRLKLNALLGNIPLRRLGKARRRRWPSLSFLAYRLGLCDRTTFFVDGG